MLTRCKISITPIHARSIVLGPSLPSYGSQTHPSSQEQDKNGELRAEKHWKSVFDETSRSTPLLGQGRQPKLSPDLFSSRKSTSKRGYSSETRSGTHHDASDAATGSNSQKKHTSLFNSDESPWDHVFDNLDISPQLLASSGRISVRPVSSSSSRTRRSRRQSMTAREISAFDDMFNMIFNAVGDQKSRLPGSGSAVNAGRVDTLSSAGIGRGPEGSSPVGDLFKKLQSHSKKFTWSAEADGVLDRKKEEMELCTTDQQLLEWATREVFDDSQHHEAAARHAMEVVMSGEELNTSSMLQSPAYPHLIALLIRAFREKYHDPHLALSIFDHARHLSIASYVFGCTTHAYNELIETRWACFRDLRGVLGALEEMRVNGVEPDSHTARLVETLRREVGARNLWQEKGDTSSGEVFRMLNKIEALVAREKPRTRNVQSLDRLPNPTKRKRWNAASEQWKLRGALDERHVDDDWEFGRWEHTKRLGRPPSKPKPKSRVDPDAGLEFL